MRAQLIPLDGSQTIELTKDLTLVGRREDCDLRIDHKSVSKIHCVLVKSVGLLLLRDLGSTNGTKVNGQRVRRAALLPDDQISIAGFEFRVRLGPSEAAAASVPIDEHTQQLDAKDLVQLLRKVSKAKAEEKEDDLPAAPAHINALPDKYPDAPPGK